MKQFFTYVKNDFISRLKSKKSKFKGVSYAFTLAEVLITLGVIGVVAAMTLPTLIQNYKNQVYVNKLKKTVATIENGFRKAAADEGVAINQSSLFKFFSFYLINGDYDEAYEKRYDIISKYFNVSGKVDINNGHIDKGISFMDGSVISYTTENYSAIPIDVNGSAKPNIVGKDIFYLLQNENGILHDYIDCTYVSSDYFSPDGVITNSVEDCGYCNTHEYDSCYLYKLRSNGWKMDY